MADSYQHSTESRFAQAALNFVAKDEFPVELVCPITQTLMQDPVLTVQGNVYERAAITEWLQVHSIGGYSAKYHTALTTNQGSYGRS